MVNCTHYRQLERPGARYCGRCGKDLEGIKAQITTENEKVRVDTRSSKRFDNILLTVAGLYVAFQAFMLVEDSIVTSPKVQKRG